MLKDTAPETYTIVSSDGRRGQILERILTLSLTSRGVVPRQRLRTPSVLKIILKQSNDPVYARAPSIDCILVLTLSKGIVAYTVMIPAKPPAIPGESATS